jgi:hypothetical protein
LQWIRGLIGDLISVFYLWISSFPSTICIRSYLFSKVCLWPLCQNSGGYSHLRNESSFPSPLFCWSFIWFCASNMALLLLWLCSTVEIQYWVTTALLFLINISLAIKFLLCFHMNFRINYLLLWRMTLEFWWAFIESVDCF